MTYRTSLLLAGLLLSTAVLDVAAQQPATTASAAPAGVLDLRRVQPVSGDAQAGAGKAAVCAACHGAQGVAIAPNFPNLAGQSATYLYVQLKEFHDGQRSDPVMSGQAAALSDADMRDLASYYAALAPKPAGQADANSRGAQLYLAGDPAQGIPPCQGCHGPAGLGPQPHPSSAPQPPWATFPHLRGQSGLYVTKQLGDFKSGARAGSSNAKVMHGIAATLGDDDVQALSTWLSTW
ncbi:MULTISPECIES: c-type cytochrome [unclassified Rhodanobacter]|uniref:c-type cytochrome n=1 Tax=unclassified Rhodanobacter TaxID=2621553 RepID=UPI001BDFCA0D|nr:MULTISPECIES: c-type cytochrome [unclassified Rhodanobacter]MBT2144323.1 cytochrome c4 [Rhodanobacter sp. LX-99]MBT2150010.1 cytochrome c4 [Rhodanobacter sp. LX-100]